jgi:uncharacterized RDD family membrane protein YckC
LFGPLEIAKPAGGRNRTPEHGAQVPRSRRTEEPGQKAFDFESRALPTSTIATVYCNAPVASAGPRITAAIVDIVIPVCGFAIFVTAFHLMAGAVEVSARTLQFYGAAALLILLFYRLLCCVANVDTPGMQFAGLRLLNMDGHFPQRRARFIRLGGGFISLVSAGLGLLWALFDEERLAWHDHMSGTFPTRL